MKRLFFRVALTFGLAFVMLISVSEINSNPEDWRNRVVAILTAMIMVAIFRDWIAEKH